MSRRDGTGPAGAGPITGRGMGFCVVKIPDIDEQGSTILSEPVLAERSNTMPRGDGTGPTGMGSMTGRAAGYCAGYAGPGFMAPIPGRGGGGGGRGRGGGAGRGWRHRFYATGLPGWQQGVAGAPVYGRHGTYVGPTERKQEVDELKAQAGYLQDALEGIKKRVDELECEVPEK